MISNKTKKMLASYARSVLAALSALYLAGVTDPLDLAWSLGAALIPVAMRALNPNDPAFGLMPAADVVYEAAKNAVPKKAPTKKASIKK